MSLIFEERPSESSFVDRIWRSHSESAGPFISMALNRMQMVVWTDNIKTYFTVRGPETKATPAHCPVHAEFLGIVFACGAFMPHLPISNFVDGLVSLPEATSTRFWLHGSAWQFPHYDNADTFVERLVRQGLLVREPIVESTLQGRQNDLSLRSAQRRFLRATGLTHSAVRQIERARYATALLQQGASIIDTVFQAGYFDQPHLTRSLRYYIGQTPAQIIDTNRSEQLSFLYKISPFR